MSKGIEIIKDRLQRKREQYIRQEEKIEQMKCTMQNTSEEIEQLEYVLSEMEHILDTHREPRVIPNDNRCLFWRCTSSAFTPRATGRTGI